MVGFWNCQKNKIYENSIIARGTLSSKLVIFGYACYIESIYGSWTKHTNNYCRAKVTRGGDNRSVAVLSDLPVIM